LGGRREGADGEGQAPPKLANVRCVLDERTLIDAFYRHFYHVGLRQISLVEAAGLYDKVKEIRKLNRPRNPNDPFEWFADNVRPETVINYG
jgi:hypothetical protein